MPFPERKYRDFYKIVCVYYFSSFPPLQGSVCEKGPVWSQGSSAVGCVITPSRVHGTQPAVTPLLPAPIIAACLPGFRWENAGMPGPLLSSVLLALHKPLGF